MIKTEQEFLNEEQLPLVWRVTQGGDAGIETVVAWLREHRPMLVEARYRHGAVLLRGFEAIDSAPRFATILDVLAPELMDYVGGSAPRSVVQGRVFTTSELPENYTLALHQEMAYQNNPPDSLVFFCEIPPEERGETPLADARAVTARLDPAVRARVAAKGVGVRRTLPTPEAVHKKPGIPKSWTDVFGTSDRDEVARIARDKEWKVTWLPDGSVQLWQSLLPGFKTHARTAERVWFNQAHYHAPECTLRWALRDQRMDDAARIKQAMADCPEMLDYVFHDDGTPISGADAEHIWDVLVNAEIPMRWNKGDVLLVDNILAMHGRRSFRGPRRILVGMIREQEAADRPAPGVLADALAG
jgi:alpha-ketoglutarate-dependent taurine dioxygenase